MRRRRGGRPLRDCPGGMRRAAPPRRRGAGGASTRSLITTALTARSCQPCLRGCSHQEDQQEHQPDPGGAQQPRRSAPGAAPGPSRSVGRRRTRPAGASSAASRARPPARPACRPDQQRPGRRPPARPTMLRTPRTVADASGSTTNKTTATIAGTSALDQVGDDPPARADRPRPPAAGRSPGSVDPDPADSMSCSSSSPSVVRRRSGCNPSPGPRRYCGKSISTEIPSPSSTTLPSCTGTASPAGSGCRSPRRDGPGSCRSSSAGR